MVQNIPPVIRRKQLVELTGLSRMTIERLELAGEFPQRFNLTPSGRSVAWRGDEVARWIDERAATRPGR